MKKIIFNLAALGLFVAVFAQFSTSAAPAVNAAPAGKTVVVAAPNQKQSVTGEVTGYVMRGGRKEAAKDVQPGEVILWELKLQNNSDKAISGIKYDAAIPSGTLFVQNSESAAAEYSLDNKSFSRSPVVRDSNGNTVAAPVSSFVAIRFTVSLNAGETKTLTYQTTVR